MSFIVFLIVISNECSNWKLYCTTVMLKATEYGMLYSVYTYILKTVIVSPITFLHLVKIKL